MHSMMHPVAVAESETEGVVEVAAVARAQKTKTVSAPAFFVNDVSSVQVQAPVSVQVPVNPEASTKQIRRSPETGVPAVPVNVVPSVVLPEAAARAANASAIHPQNSYP
jgi:hypothetical protein